MSIPLATSALLAADLVLCAEKTAETPALCMVVLIHREMVSFDAFLYGLTQVIKN